MTRFYVRKALDGDSDPKGPLHVTKALRIGGE